MRFRSVLLALGLCVLGAALLRAEPRQVILIRHGEKPEQGDGLSLKGLERAAALVPFLSQRDGDRSVPCAIFAQGPTSKRTSQRPVETVAPLAQSLGIQVKTFHHSAVADMVKQVLSNRKYDGKTVLICWEHHGIPDIATAMGVQKVPEWPGQVYDRLWIVTFQNGKPKLSNLPQKLLFQDSAE
jgi:hypothetical protein